MSTATLRRVQLACAPTTRAADRHGPVARTAGGVAGWVDDRTGAAKP